MRARLTAESGECIPSAIDLLPGTPITLGRSRDNTIVLKDDSSSRLHAKIYYDGGRWYVRDFGLNGTRLNDATVNGVAECRMAESSRSAKSAFASNRFP